MCVENRDGGTYGSVRDGGSILDIRRRNVANMGVMRCIKD